MALWERQKGETTAAYSAFWEYCTSVENNKRSVSRVAEKLKKSASLLHRWSKRWEWEQRALAYDNHLIEIEMEALKNERITAAKRHAKIARAFQEKIIRRLNSLNPEVLSPKDLSAWLDVSVKIERQAMGEPTEIVSQEIAGKDGSPLNPPNIVVNFVPGADDDGTDEKD